MVVGLAMLVVLISEIDTIPTPCPIHGIGSANVAKEQFSNLDSILGRGIMLQ